MNWLKQLAPLLGVAQNKDDQRTCADALGFNSAVDAKRFTCQEVRETPESPQKPPATHALTESLTHLT